MKMETNIHKLNGFIYVTSEEEINQKTKPCWCLNTIKKTFDDDLIYYQGCMPQYHFIGFKKIILTNDPNLTNVQQLTQEEVEYCNGVDECEMVKGRCRLNDDGEEIGFPDMSLYKLQLPKQKEMKAAEMKAKELVDIYFKALPTPCMDTYNDIFKVHKERAIQCAIISQQREVDLLKQISLISYLPTELLDEAQEVLTILKEM